jgi:hypothetical protein
MSMLLAAKGRSSITVQNVTSVATGTDAPVVASIMFNRDGSVVYDVGAYTWYPSITLNIGFDYEILAEVVDAPVNTFIGTIGTWQPISISRTWQLSINSGNDTGSIRFSIRRVGETVVMALGVTEFYCEVLV